MTGVSTQRRLWLGIVDSVSQKPYHCTNRAHARPASLTILSHSLTAHSSPFSFPRNHSGWWFGLFPGCTRISAALSYSNLVSTVQWGLSSPGTGTTHSEAILSAPFSSPDCLAHVQSASLTVPFILMSPETEENSDVLCRLQPQASCPLRMHGHGRGSDGQQDT